VTVLLHRLGVAYLSLMHPRMWVRRDADGNLRWDRAYAMTDPMEYFAESTEAFFSRNDFFPFDRAELERHDPEMARLLVELWGTGK
jgi:hypothetical protein